MIGMRYKYYKGYYRGIQIEKRGSKYIKKELSKREVERNNIGKKVVRMDKRMEGWMR